LEEDEYVARNKVMAEEYDDFAKLQQCNEILQKLQEYKQQSQESNNPQVSEMVTDIENMVKELLGEELKIADSGEIIARIQQHFDELAGSARILNFDKLFFGKRSQSVNTAAKSAPTLESSNPVKVDDIETLPEQSSMLAKFGGYFASVAKENSEDDSGYISSQYEEFRSACKTHQNLLSLLTEEEKDRKSIEEQEEIIKQKLVENFNKNMKGLIMQFAVKLQMHEMKHCVDQQHSKKGAEFNKYRNNAGTLMDFYYRSD
jgi:hypothetical protein